MRKDEENSRVARAPPPSHASSPMDKEAILSRAPPSTHTCASPTSEDCKNSPKSSGADPLETTGTDESLYITPPRDDDICYLCLELMPPQQAFVSPPARMKHICCGKECCIACSADMRMAAIKLSLSAAQGLMLAGQPSVSINFATCQLSNTVDDSRTVRRKKSQSNKKPAKAAKATKGKVTSPDCFEEEMKGADLLINKCSMCRSELPYSLEEEFKLILDHAEKGLVWAIPILASYYDQGIGVVANASKSIHWTKIGAGNGDAQSQSILGMCYAQGARGVQENKVEARRLFALAADNNEACAQFWYGIMLHNGEGGRKDVNEAFRYMAYSARNGYVDAQLELGKFYSLDRSDLRMALFWATKAAENGHVESCYLVGCWMIMEAQSRLGSEFSTGQSPMPVALRWLQKAASWSHVDAMREVEKSMSLIQSRCEHCCTRDRSLRWCSRCQAAKYCSTECQHANWRAGHKVDCCDVNGLKDLKQFSRRRPT